MVIAGMHALDDYFRNVAVETISHKGQIGKERTGNQEAEEGLPRAVRHGWCLSAFILELQVEDADVVDVLAILGILV